MGQADAAAETYLRLGNVFAGQQDMDAAIEAWLRAVELVPDKIDAYHKLAQALIQLGKTRVAARHYLSVAAIYQDREDHKAGLTADSGKRRCCSLTIPALPQRWKPRSRP
jgi:tetratricopeptide (TPR) repeat protein